MKKIYIYGIFLIATILLFSQFNFEEVLFNINKINFNQMFLLILFQFISMLLITFQWKIIVKVTKNKISFLQMFMINLMGTFVESITPAVKAGGEATKVIMLKKVLESDSGNAIAIVGVQKTISAITFASLSILSVFYYLLTVAIDSNAMIFLFFALVITLGIVLLMVLLMVRANIVFHLIMKISFLKKYEDTINKSYDQFNYSMALFKECPGILKRQFFLSFCIWILFPVKTYLIMSFLGVSLHFFTVAAITYLTYMIGMIPLLPGGIGSFEASVVFLLLPLGVANHDGLSIAILLRFVTFWFVFLVSAFTVLLERKLKLISV